MSTAMTKLLSLIAVLLVVFCQVGFAQTAPVAPLVGRVLGLLELRDAVNSTDEAKQRELAYSAAPANASFQTTDMYYGAMLLGALKISDLPRVETIAKLWNAAQTGSNAAKDIRFAILSQGIGLDLEEAIKLGEANVASATHITLKIMSRSDLAILYVSLGEFEKAETLLSEAELTVRNEQPKAGLRGDWAFWTPYSRAQYLKTRCIQKAALFQLKQAEEFCLQAVGSQNDAIKYKRLANPFAQLGVGTFQVQTYSKLAKIYSKTNRFYDAELAIKQMNELIATGQTFGVAHAWVFEANVQLALARKDVNQYAMFREVGLKLGKSFNASEVSIAGVLLHKHLQTAFVVGERWQRAQEEFDKRDALIANADHYIKQAALNIVPRSLTYLNNGRAAAALPLLTVAHQKSALLLGNANPQSALLLGLHALALVGAEPSQEATALLELDAAVAVMANADSLTEEYFGQAERPIARQMIFEKYLELAGKNADPRFSGRALGIADSLRSSGVQQAMNDSAIRASASTPALADLVRRDQDDKRELQSLYNFISNRAGEIEAKRLENVMTQMKTRIAELEKSRAALTLEITQQFPEYSRLTRPTSPTLTEIAAKLKPEEALLTLLPTDKAVYVWAISQGAGGAVNQAFSKVDLNKEQLTGLVKRLRTSLDVAGLPAHRMPTFDHQAAQALYAKLLMPVQSGLQGKTSLIVAAGGALGQIPFGVLQTADKDSWLIQQAAITHVPSVAAWLSMRALPHKTAEQPMLAWGDPLFNLAIASNSTKGDVRKVNLTRANTAVDLEKEDPKSALKYADIPALPETRDELLAIAKTLGADAAKDIILGSQATRDSVLRENKNGNLAKRRVVAFATHGLMAGDLPNLTQPALAMAGTKDDATNVLAPLLTLEDVLTLKLNADWVVLSACNTAAADGKAEEALSGLARGFFYAGSRSLLVTHWAVDSESAVTLTTETFKHYQTNPTAAKAESLRQAMLKVMSEPKTAHPAYWAPYALVGDGAR
jgi:CHAT domain-containing protein/tetratricopeptide (TPR) repeat protein